MFQLALGALGAIKLLQTGSQYLASQQQNKTARNDAQRTVSERINANVGRLESNYISSPISQIRNLYAQDFANIEREYRQRRTTARKGIIPGLGSAFALSSPSLNSLYDDNNSLT